MTRACGQVLERFSTLFSFLNFITTLSPKTPISGIKCFSFFSRGLGIYSKRQRKGSLLFYLDVLYEVKKMANRIFSFFVNTEMQI